MKKKPMGNIFNADFRDYEIAINKNEVEYVIVGGYAVMLHRYSSTTCDIDIWVNKTRSNYSKLVRAFYDFNMPLMGMTEEIFSVPKCMFSLMTTHQFLLI